MLNTTLIAQDNQLIDIETYYVEKEEALSTELLDDDLESLLNIRNFYSKKFKFDSVRIYDELISETASLSNDKNLHIKHYLLCLASDVTMGKNLVDINQRVKYVSQFIDDPAINHNNKSNIYQRLANHEVNSANTIKGLEYAQLMVMQADSSVDQISKFHGRIQLTDFQIMNNKYLGAINTSLEAEQLALLQPDPSFALFKVNRQLGYIFHQIDDFKKSEEYLLKALEIAKEKNYKSFAIDVQYDIGMLYYDNNNLTLADKYANLALTGLKASKIKSLKAEIYSLNLKVQTAKNDFEGGKQFRDTLFQILEEVDKSSNRVPLYINIANYDLKYGSINSAKKILKIVDNLKITKGFSNDANLSFVKFKLAKLEGDMEKALEHHLQYVKIKDTLATRNNKLLVQRIEAENYRAKQTLEIASLNQVNNAQDKALSIRNVALIMGSIMLLVLGLLLFGLYNLYNKNKLQTIQIEKALANNQLLIKEIHHRVKNNLQVVSSLLNMQARKIADFETKDALNSSKMRVQSMSIIHQNLYHGQQLSSVNIGVYMNQLIDNISATYSLNENVNIEVKVDDIDIDVDTLVPLGLIANELICNALKYAFPDNRKGNLSISLTEYENDIMLQVKDDGIGLAGDFIPKKERSLGARLISSFVDRLDGEIVVKGTKGTNVKITFPKDIE